MRHLETHPKARRRSLQVIEDGVYVMDGRLAVTEINDVLGLNLPPGESRTIAGMLLNHLRRIPREGEYVIESGYRFTVEEAIQKAVLRVRAEPEA